MENPDDELLRKLQATFKVEAAEYLQILNTALLQIERSVEATEVQALLQESFRAAHNMKGAARTVGLKEVQTLSHSIENVFQQARDNKLTLTPVHCDVLYHTFDAIKALLDGKSVALDELVVRLGKMSVEKIPAAPSPNMALTTPTQSELVGAIDDLDDGLVTNRADFPAALGASGEETIRVAIGKLDALMADTGELLTSKISADQHLNEMTQIQYQLSLWPKTLDDFGTLLRRVNGPVGLQLGEILSQHQDYLQTLSQNIDGVQQSIARNTLRLGMITNRIQDEVRQVRLVPFQSIIFLLQRTVRDAARSQNKQVALLVVIGGEVELDKKVLEILKDPLLHLLRNAVAHGIEYPNERLATNKPAEGHITLTIQQRGNEVSIEVKDDGKGFDFAALRAHRSHNGGARSDESMTADELINLAFAPGVSTATEITELAGRGVGLDVVRQSVEALQGRIEVSSHPGRGTAFQLVVPVSLTTTFGLLVRIANEQYILPLLSIEKIIHPDVSFSIEGQLMISVDNQPIPLISLAAALNRPFSQEIAPSKTLAIVVRAADQRMAVLVDDILSQQEVTIKPLSNLFPRVLCVAGAAILGSGEPVLVLNTTDLVKVAKQSEMAPITMPQLTLGVAPEQNVAPHDHYILVVDDSITTRTLEKNILQAAGYKVITATDGELALKQLKENRVDLVVSDVQMPNLDGIGLTQSLRESKQYSNLPVILVTSLERTEDRERGLMAGANAYIVKRGFDQAELLSTIERLL